MANEAERERILRVLDVNRNRALEALRTVEEYARFVLEAAGPARAAKELRHTLQQALDRPALAGALAARDVAGDLGHPERVADTRERTGAADVAAANLARAKEALRALEEYSKALDPAAAAAVSRVRYGVYELEPRLLVPARSSLEGRTVYLIVGSAPGRPPVIDQVSAALAGGVRLLQLREKGLADGALLALAREVNDRVQAAGGLLILNDRPDLARLAGAAGVHLGQDDLPPREARRIVGPAALIGVSAHSLDELEGILGPDVDYVGAGTLFASPTKPDLAAVGLELIAELAPRCPVPLYGIGGVTLETAPQVVAAGASGVAVSGAVLDAPDLEAAARALVRALEPAPPDGAEEAT